MPGRAYGFCSARRLERAAERAIPVMNEEALPHPGDESEGWAIVPRRYSRRMLLKATGGAGASLLLGSAFIGSYARPAAAEPWLNAWVRIRADGKAVIQVSQTEMGQGISTTLPVALAEELGVALEDIICENAP